MYQKQIIDGQVVAVAVYDRLMEEWEEITEEEYHTYVTDDVPEVLAAETRIPSVEPED